MSPGVSFYVPKKRLDQIAPLDEPWQVEDARRTAATHMRSLGVDRVVVDKILNHVDGGIIRVYDRWSALGHAPVLPDALAVWAAMGNGREHQANRRSIRLAAIVPPDPDDSAHILQIIGRDGLYRVPTLAPNTRTH